MERRLWPHGFEFPPERGLPERRRVFFQSSVPPLAGEATETRVIGRSLDGASDTLPSRMPPCAARCHDGRSGGTTGAHAICLPSAILAGPSHQNARRRRAAAPSPAHPPIALVDARAAMLVQWALVLALTALCLSLVVVGQVDVERRLGADGAEERVPSVGHRRRVQEGEIHWLQRMGGAASLDASHDGALLGRRGGRRVGDVGESHCCRLGRGCRAAVGGIFSPGKDGVRRCGVELCRRAVSSPPLSAPDADAFAFHGLLLARDACPGFRYA